MTRRPEIGFERPDPARIPVPGCRGHAALLLALALAVGCASGPEPGAAEVDPATQAVAPLVREAERNRDSGNYDRAIEAYSDAFGRTPWNTKLKRALAVTHSERAAAARQTGELEPAERDLRAALDLYPEDREFRRGLAVVLLEQLAYQSDPERADAWRQEIRMLDPQLEVPDRVVNPAVERQVDLAFELIERGQLDAGIADLERIQTTYPGDASSAHLLAQALVRRSGQLSQRSNFPKAKADLDRAVELYASLAPCRGNPCTREELRIAHYNRVAICLNMDDRPAARRALDQARAAGLSFPDLEDRLSR